jgi:hypothetical protein
MVVKFLLRPDVFPARIAIWVGPWADEAIALYLQRTGLQMRTETAVKAPSSAEGGCCYTFDAGCLIWLPGCPKTPEEHSTLSHEALHAVSHIGAQLGLTLTEASEEWYCYFQSWLVRSVLERLAKLNSRERSKAKSNESSGRRLERRPPA